MLPDRLSAQAALRLRPVDASTQMHSANMMVEGPEVIPACAGQTQRANPVLRITTAHSLGSAGPDYRAPKKPHHLPCITVCRFSLLFSRPEGPSRKAKVRVSPCTSSAPGFTVVLPQSAGNFRLPPTHLFSQGLPVASRCFSTLVAGISPAAGRRRLQRRLGWSGIRTDQQRPPESQPHAGAS